MEIKNFRRRDAELRAEREAVTRERAAIGDAVLAREEGERRMTAEERAEFLKLGKRIEELDAEIVANDDAYEAAKESRRAIWPEDPSTMRQVGTARPTGRTFAEMFPQFAASLEGWRDAGEFLNCVGRGLYDPRLRADTQLGSQDSAGGFSVPGALWSQWLDLALESELVRPRARVYAMSSDTLDVIAGDDTDRSGGLLSGLKLNFQAEASEATVQVAKLRAMRLRARKASIFCEASSELLSDAAAFDRNLTALMTSALSWGLDREFLFGTGANGPLGCLVAPATVTVTRASAGTIIFDDVIEMFARLLPGSVERSIWIASPSCIPKLATLSVAVGTGGNAIPVMSENDGSFRILTRPCYFSEKVAALGSTSDISLVDLSHYAVGLRREASIERSMHVGFTRDVQTYRVTLRIDGQPDLASAITPRNGGSTLSPFVTLA